MQLHILFELIPTGAYVCLMCIGYCGFYLRRRRRLCFRCSLFVCLSVCLSVRRITRKLV